MLVREQEQIRSIMDRAVYARQSAIADERAKKYAAAVDAFRAANAVGTAAATYFDLPVGTVFDALGKVSSLRSQYRKDLKDAGLDVPVVYGRDPETEAIIAARMRMTTALITCGKKWKDISSDVTLFSFAISTCKTYEDIVAACDGLTDALAR